jgi:cell filamentation protein
MYEVDDDRYWYRGTSVLKNRAGFRSQIELDKFEALCFTSRAAEPLPAGKLSQTHYCAVHRHLFRDVYAWAGRFRQVRIGKNGSMFCYPENIPEQMRRLFDSLADQNCLRDLEGEPFSSAAAHFLSELNAIHPFREGNGRTQNIFLAVLADQAAHPLDSLKIDPPELLQATITAFHGNEMPLVNVILNAMRA